MPEDPIEDRRKEAARLARDLAELDFVLRGSIVRRMVTCNTPNCRCNASPANRHGPYWDWTRKVRGKTVTVRLSPEQVAVLQPWIENSRRADRTLSEMERVTRKAVEQVLKKG